MIKRLKDICILKISLWARDLDRNDYLQKLTRQDRERILYHMSCHQLIFPKSLKFVESVLLVKSLKRIELHHSLYIRDYMLQIIAKNSSSIEHISIVECKNVTDVGISTLVKNQISLWFLRLQSLPLVTGECLKSFISDTVSTLILQNMLLLQDVFVVDAMSQCPNIKVLDLQYCPEISDSCIIAASAILREKLVVMKISGISKITDQSLECLIANCTGLKELKLYGCNKLSTEGINKMLKSLENLQNIDISYTCAYHGGVDIANFQADDFGLNLKRFVSCGVQIPVHVLLNLADRCKMLTALVLCGIKSIDDSFLKQIALVIGDRLKEIDLSYCNTVTDTGIETLVNKYTALQSLTFQHFQGTGGPLKYFALESKTKQTHQITHLNFPACRYFDSHAVEVILPFLTNIVQLDLSGMKDINDDFLRQVAAHCRNIKIIGLKACTKVTDDGICKIICNGSPLEKLVLSGMPKLTDKSIFTMASCISTTLKLLYISGCTRISPPVIQYLKDECVDGVYIQHRVPNAPANRVMGKDINTGQYEAIEGDKDLFYWTPTI